MLPFAFSSPIKRIYWHSKSTPRFDQLVDFRQGKVDLRLNYSGAYPTESIFSSLFQVCHFETTQLKLSIPYKGAPVPDQVFQQLFRWLAENHKLESLEWQIDLISIHHAEGLFSALENLKGLRLLNIESYPDHLDPEYSWMLQLLSRNRNIELFDNIPVGMCSEHDYYFSLDVDKLLRLNRVYRGSAFLGQESHSIRVALVGIAATQSAAGSFQRSALLLADHSDALCQLIQNQVCLFDSAFEETILPEHSQESELKRKATTQAEQVAKKGR